MIICLGSGRDIEEKEFALSFDTTRCVWIVLGDAIDFRQTQKEKEIIDLFNDQGATKYKILILNKMWRRGWDSNPRNAFTFAGFQDQFLKPLGHLSTNK